MGWVDDLLAVLGAGALVYGAWLVYEPAGPIAGGVLLLSAAALRGRARASRGAG